MVYRMIKVFLLVVILFPISFSLMANSWTEVDLDDEAEFKNECEYRIKSKAYANGQSVLKSYDVNPKTIRFYIGGIHNPGYIEAAGKHKLCTDALEAPSYIDTDGNSCNFSSEFCHQQCLVLDSVLSIEELCQ